MIKNLINDKKYIGKTLDTIEARWKEHCQDYKRERCEKRPLYNAMNKYGLDAFEIIEIEEVDNSIINEREKYWIAYYDTFHGDGYNGTEGGDGKQLYDYKELVDKYLELGTIKETAKFIHCDKDTVKKALKEYNIPIKSSDDINKERYEKKIICYSKNKEKIQEFNTISDGGRWVIQQGLTKMTDPAKVGVGIRRAAQKRTLSYGYYWELV